MGEAVCCIGKGAETLPIPTAAPSIDKGRIGRAINPCYKCPVASWGAGGRTRWRVRGVRVCVWHHQGPKWLNSLCRHCLGLGYVSLLRRWQRCCWLKVGQIWTSIFQCYLHASHPHQPKEGDEGGTTRPRGLNTREGQGWQQHWHLVLTGIVCDRGGEGL